MAIQTFTFQYGATTMNLFKNGFLLKAAFTFQYGATTMYCSLYSLFMFL